MPVLPLKAVGERAARAGHRRALEPRAVSVNFRRVPEFVAAAAPAVSARVKQPHAIERLAARRVAND